jgi:hypothetical protein
MTKTIKQLCEEYGIGQMELSRMYDIPWRTVQDWYAGRRNPPPYVVRMLDELLRADEPIFRFNFGDVVYDKVHKQSGEVIARTQTRYGLITYELKAVPPAREIWVAVQEMLELKKEETLVYTRQAQEHVEAEEISAEDLESAEIVKAQGRELLARTKAYLQRDK